VYLTIKNKMVEFMLGYLIIATSLSALIGAIFYLIFDQPSGAGIAMLAALVLGGITWKVKNKK